MGVRCPAILVREAACCQVVYLRPVILAHLVFVSLVMHMNFARNLIALFLSTRDGVTLPPGCVCHSPMNLEPTGQLIGMLTALGVPIAIGPRVSWPLLVRQSVKPTSFFGSAGARIWPIGAA